MCYGMRCHYEDNMGECTWDGGLPFPCPKPDYKHTITSIPFTQFLRPDGRTRNVKISMPREVENKAQDLISNGARFEIEVLTTGEIYMECLIDDNLLANQLCSNGPPVVDAVKELILAASAKI